MKDILVYRKGLTDKILKDKERERELAAKKEMGMLAIEDKDKGGKQSRYAQPVYILPERANLTRPCLAQIVQF